MWSCVPRVKRSERIIIHPPHAPECQQLNSCHAGHKTQGLESPQKNTVLRWSRSKDKVTIVGENTWTKVIPAIGWGGMNSFVQLNVRKGAAKPWWSVWAWCVWYPLRCNIYSNLWINSPAGTEANQEQLKANQALISPNPSNHSQLWVQTFCTEVPWGGSTGALEWAPSTRGGQERS